MFGERVRAGAPCLVVAAVAATLLAASPTAIASPSPQPPDPHDVAFVGHLTDHGVPFASAPEAISLAQATCKILDTGSPTRIEKAVMRVRGELTMRPDQVQSFVETAVGDYCPGCADRLGLTPSPSAPEFASVGSESDLTPRKPERPTH